MTVLRLQIARSVATINRPTAVTSRSRMFGPSARTWSRIPFFGNREADYYSEASLGEGIPAKIGLQFSTADVLPTVNISGTGSPSSITPAQKHFSSRTVSLSEIW